MGSAYVYRCKDCGMEHEVSFGIGFLYPEHCRELRRAALNGTFGEEWRKIMSENRFCVIEAENYLYYCQNCGCWECGPQLSIYAPKDPDSLLKKRCGEKTIEEWGYDPHGRMNREDYRLLKRYRHVCPDCGKTMKQYSEKNIDDLQLKCPACDGELVRGEGRIDWD